MGVQSSKKAMITLSKLLATLTLALTPLVVLIKPVARMKHRSE